MKYIETPRWGGGVNPHNKIISSFIKVVKINE